MSLKMSHLCHDLRLNMVTCSLVRVSLSMWSCSSEAQFCSWSIMFQGVVIETLISTVVSSNTSHYLCSESVIDQISIRRIVLLTFVILLCQGEVEKVCMCGVAVQNPVGKARVVVPVLVPHVDVSVLQP